jgi:hypothetical protein
MMHHVEEWHSATCHLPPGMRLADTQQCREMRHDAEEEENPQSKAVLGRLSVGVNGDHEAGNEPQVPAAQPQPAR